MFKSIQWKIIAIFIMLTVAVMMVVGTFLLQNISSYYHNSFSDSMNNSVFTQSVKDSFDAAANDSDSVEKLSNLLNIYSIRMGINSFRNFYILDGQSAAVIKSSDTSAKEVAVTPNILLAMSGSYGSEIDQDASYLDFALPLRVDQEVKYIIYVFDSKETLYDIIDTIFINILWALLFGLVLSAFLGFLFSRTIIAPISTLQMRAESMAEGDFGHKIEVKSRDEIGRLTVAFNEMAARLNTTLDEISAQKNKVETILAHMTDGVAAFDSSGQIIHINPAAENLIGDYADKDFNKIFKELGVNLFFKSILYLNYSQTIERDIEKDGKIFKAYFAPFSMENQRSGGVVVVFQDITQHHKLDMARREFVANVSHELRTPLTTIKSYAETILDMEKGNTVCNFVSVIENEADRMARIVTDLLTLSKLDSAKQSLSKSTFNLSLLAQNVVTKLSIDAKNHGHLLIFTEESKIPQFYGDKDKMEQVITNIISNSIKYTPNGGKIEVVCGVKYTDAYIKVTDNGIGIPKSDLNRIFERFYRVDKARSREKGGTGLGLAIAKEIVDMHGGKISIESPVNSGTIVTITVPLFSE